MRELLFERPITLLVLWAVAEFVLICVWRARRDRTTARIAAAGLASGAVLLAMSFLVVTAKERVVATCNTMARAIDSGEIAAISTHLTADFEAAGLNRAEFLESVELALSRFRVDRPRLYGFVIEFPVESTAVASFGALCRIRAQRMYGQIPSRWRVRFRRVDETWLVTGIESLPIPPLNVADLRQWLR